MILTAITVKNSKRTDKVYRLKDGKGLFLEVPPKGSKRWRLRYQFKGKGQLISLGTYPEVSLQEAREKQLEARSFISKGINPSDVRKKQKEELSGSNTFESIAGDWWFKNKSKWSEGHANTIWSRLSQNIFPWLGKVPISEITALDLLKQLKRVEQRGAIETAHRIKSICGQVFRYAVVIREAERDITYDLQEALIPTPKKNYSAIIEPQKVGELLRAIEGYQGSVITRYALMIAPLLFVRPGELRHAEWKEFNFEDCIWRIPAEKMKMKKVHLVPLSRQAIEIIRDCCTTSKNS